MNPGKHTNHDVPDGENQDRESMTFDVVIVGGGVAGLACAIRIQQKAQDLGQDISVCVVDKGSEIGAHTMSGAVIDPRALTELFADWKNLGAPLSTPVKKDTFVFLTATKAFKLFTPPQMKNRGNYVASLGALCRWLGEQAENLGAEVFAGFAATQVLYGKDGRVIGISTGDMGRLKDGSPGPNFTPGVDLLATYTVFAEGCRGSLSERVMDRFDLRAACQHQTYGLGIKEVWEVSSDKHKPGHVLHTVGWPLSTDTFGGSFLYHMDDNKVAVGFITGLDYENPYRSPFDDMQRFKTHPKISPLFEGAKRVAFGARALNEGGIQSIPKLVFPGGALIGAAAGFMNTPRIKGSHTAMKSGIVLGDALVAALTQQSPPLELSAYCKDLEASWVYAELRRARNIRPAFGWGLWVGLIYGVFDTYIMKGRTPWTFKHSSSRGDHDRLRPATHRLRLDYEKPDHVLTFDRASSVHLANTVFDNDQPCPILLKDAEIPVTKNRVLYDGPETRFCPAGVFEFIKDDQGDERLHMNVENCVHCKTCDIKDPNQNIIWTPPQGGNGPNYSNM